jgi:hypothetical protein
MVTTPAMRYSIHPTNTPPAPDADWNSTAWQKSEILTVSHFRPESSEHHPLVQARLLWDETALHGIFHVRDRYVRCVRTRYFDEVWKDSCVEFFVEPVSGGGYFNFEFNCGGAHLCNYITDHRRVEGGFARADKLPPEIGKQVSVHSTLPPVVDPELAEPTYWSLQFRIPYKVFEHYTGKLGNPAGQTWRGNFFKCAEEVSHPHWASWSPVDEFNFHLPRCFGHLRFA